MPNRHAINALPSESDNVRYVNLVRLVLALPKSLSLGVKMSEFCATVALIAHLVRVSLFYGRFGSL